jgi:hypothetical protein
MDLQAEKIELAKLLLETNDQSVLDEIKAVFEKQGHDFFDDLPQHVKDSIEAGIKDIEEGNVFEHDEVMKDIKTRYGLKS